jgi:hypothetical protein
MKRGFLFFLMTVVIVIGGTVLIKYALVMDYFMNGQLPQPVGSESFFHRMVYIIRHPHGWPAGLILLGVTGVWILIFRVGRRFFEGAKGGDLFREKWKPVAALDDADSSRLLPEMIGLPDIEAFFLTLYRRQLGAPLDAPGLKTSVPAKDKKAGRTYSLSVKVRGKWNSRRMSINPIGEAARSKSQCFYVIFDTHMVVKIPPVPIKDFSDYIGRIRHETALVQKLSPRTCIIPNLSVILDRVQPLPGLVAVGAMTREETYIHLFEFEPQYHSYLKIGGAFAFFMNLSQHFFLSYVIADLHDGAEEVKRNLASDVVAMHPGYDFEAKYGAQSTPICSAVLELYDRFESGLAACLDKSNGHQKPGNRRKREWFLSHLTGEAISKSASQGLSDATMTEVARFIKLYDPSAKKTIEAYISLVRDYADRIIFHRNRAQLEALTTNLLDLLVWLAEKGIAVRDLKPDNLLVAGDPENYPLFLRSSDNYSIGLIDLETAVDFDPPTNKAFLQPHLGGTPAYATPAHFFGNAVLQAVYGDVPRILHMQDWFAMVGIIYEAVMGDRLFLKTGGYIPAVIQTVKRARAEKRNMTKLFPVLNGAFWEAAGEEFSRKMQENEGRLTKLVVTVPRPLLTHFSAYFSAETEKIRQTLSAQHRESVENDGLKRCLAESSDLSRRTAEHECTLSVKELLGAMFGIVVEAMGGDAFHFSTVNNKETAPDAARDNELLTRSLGYTFTGEISE